VTAAAVESTATTTVEAAAPAAVEATSATEAAGSNSAVVSATVATVAIASAISTAVAVAPAIAVVAVPAASAVPPTAVVARMPPAPSIPGARTEKDTADEPVRSVIAIRGASIRIGRVIAPVAYWRAVIYRGRHHFLPDTNPNSNLRVGRDREGQNQNQCE